MIEVIYKKCASEFYRVTIKEHQMLRPELVNRHFLLAGYYCSEVILKRVSFTCQHLRASSPSYGKQVHEKVAMHKAL